MGRNKYDPVDNWVHTQVSNLGPKDASGPTAQQQQLEAAQATTVANLNLEENAQRKAILNAMQGTRLFRGSALSRAVAGNTPGGAAGPGPSPTQIRAGRGVVGVRGSLLDTGTGSTPAGGAGASGGGGGIGTYAGGGGGRSASSRA